jgi:hypothetical protein
MEVPVDARMRCVTDRPTGWRNTSQKLGHYRLFDDLDLIEDCLCVLDGVVHRGQDGGDLPLLAKRWHVHRQPQPLVDLEDHLLNVDAVARMKAGSLKVGTVRVVLKKVHLQPGLNAKRGVFIRDDRSIQSGRHNPAGAMDNLAPRNQKVAFLRLELGLGQDLSTEQLTPEYDSTTIALGRE